MRRQWSDFGQKGIHALNQKLISLIQPCGWFHFGLIKSVKPKIQINYGYQFSRSTFKIEFKTLGQVYLYVRRLEVLEIDLKWLILRFLNFLIYNFARYAFLDTLFTFLKIFAENLIFNLKETAAHSWLGDRPPGPRLSGGQKCSTL